eukprot:75910-Rhodomonas_salina.3
MVSSACKNGEHCVHMWHRHCVYKHEREQRTAPKSPRHSTLKSTGRERGRGRRPKEKVACERARRRGGKGCRESN